MDFYRGLVSVYRAGDLPIDYITNTVHFRDEGADFDDTDWGEAAQDLADLWASYRPYPLGYNRVNVKVYNMEDPEPRPIKGNVTVEFAAGNGTPSPREVALCLSFYSERNLPRNRGRIYVGPWSNAVERPGDTMMGYLQTLKQGLADIGGLDTNWCVYSRTTPGGLGEKFKPVTNAWIDDEWDTVRSRGLRPLMRNASAIEG